MKNIVFSVSTYVDSIYGSCCESIAVSVETILLGNIDRNIWTQVNNTTWIIKHFKRL